MNVLIIPFIKYSLVDHKLGSMLHEYILANISKFPVDNFIFIGTHMGWEKRVDNVKGKTISYISTYECHQENLQIAISQLNDDDKFVVMDSDLMVYDYDVFSRMFKYLDEYDIVSNLDSGCTITPTYFHIWQKGHFPEDPYLNFMYTSPIFAPNEYRGGRGRFAATLFGCTKKFWMKHCGTTDEYCSHESMEIFSRNVLKYTPDVKFKELLDYRCNVWIPPEHQKIQIYRNSDDERCDEHATKIGEYYHIRNFGETVKMIDYIIDNRVYVHHNKPESQRLLAWFTIVLEKLIQIDSSYSAYTTYIDRIRNDTDISKELFDEYLTKFKEFHRSNLL
jgi:hypothetical protein